MRFFDRTTLFVMFSALALVLACILPPTRDMLVFYAVYRAGFFTDALFHEMGHTVFSWMFGRPAIPMIFTAIGADQAGGLSLMWDFNWGTQVTAFIVMLYACYWLWDNVPGMFIPGVLFTAAIIAIAFTRYPEVVIAYMGHGGSIAAGGFFLFRAWIYLDAKNQIGRWFNAFFGFYLVLANMQFVRGLAYNSGALSDYNEHVAFGMSHNDFWKMAIDVPAWSVHGIAVFTIGYCILMLIGSLIMAMLLQNQFHESPGFD